MTGAESGSVRIGISGWQYDAWRGDFYPPGLAREHQLGYASGLMPTVEINGSFYSLQKPSSYQRWHDQTPPDFVFAVKGGRYVTHLKRLREAEVGLANFFASGVLLLGPKLGPFLWQLPEQVTFESAVLRAFLETLPRTAREIAQLAARHDDKVTATCFDAPAQDFAVRHALEVRSPSFATPAFFDILTEHGVACVVADSAGRWPVFEAPTADFEYVRLHGHSELYTSRYASATLQRWAEWCRSAAGRGRDVYVYFDNDAHGHAPHDALRLQRLLEETEGSG